MYLYYLQCKCVHAIKSFDAYTIILLIDNQEPHD